MKQGFNKREEHVRELKERVEAGARAARTGASQLAGHVGEQVQELADRALQGVGEIQQTIVQHAALSHDVAMGWLIEMLQFLDKQELGWAFGDFVKRQRLKKSADALESCKCDHHMMVTSRKQKTCDTLEAELEGRPIPCKVHGREDVVVFDDPDGVHDGILCMLTAARRVRKVGVHERCVETLEDLFRRQAEKVRTCAWNDVREVAFIGDDRYQLRRLMDFLTLVFGVFQKKWNMQDLCILRTSISAGWLPHNEMEMPWGRIEFGVGKDQLEWTAARGPAPAP